MPTIDCLSANLINVGMIVNTNHPVIASSFAFAAVSTSTTTFVDMPGLVSTPSLIKSNGTDLLVEIDCSSSVDVANTRTDFAALVNGVNYITHYYIQNLVNNHHGSSGAVRITGLVAGSYSAKARWRRGSGTGNIKMGTNDYVIIRMSEI